jgi:hypothetical protein
MTEPVENIISDNRRVRCMSSSEVEDEAQNQILDDGKSSRLHWMTRCLVGAWICKNDGCSVEGGVEWTGGGGGSEKGGSQRRCERSEADGVSNMDLARLK